MQGNKGGKKDIL